MADEKIEKALANATPEQILRLVESMKRLALVVANERLKKMMIRKLEMRLERIERMPVSKSKSIQGQDSDNSNKQKWPSLSGD